MSEATKKLDQPTTGEKSGTKPTVGEPGKTFTQEDVDKIVQDRLARATEKYGDYDDMKAKLEEIENANKSDLEKLTERASVAEAQVAAYEKEKKISTWRSEIRKEKGIPENMDSLLTGSTEDEIKAQADIIAENMPKAVNKPVVKSDKGANFTEKDTKDGKAAEYAELVESLTGGNE